jgi:chromosome segregation ATPase
MSKETTLKGKLGDLLRLSASLNANKEGLQHLEGSRAELDDQIAKAQEAADRQALHTAGKQEASKQLRASLDEGQRLANVLRLAVKQRYGIRSEKLAHFGLQPFRGRPRNAKPTTEEPQPQAPADPVR